MNLFLVHWSPEGRADATKCREHLETLAGEVPPIAAGERFAWSAPSGTAAVTSISHRAGQVGGVRYTVARENAAALFAGTLIAWEGEASAPALDATKYLADPSLWAEKLDGRFAVLRYDDEQRSLSLLTDPMGAYPVYILRGPGGAWLSNSTEVLHRIDPRGLRVESIATFLGCGWSLGGVPLWSGIDRLSGGTLHELGPRGEHAREQTGSAELARWFGGGLDAEEAGRDLTECVGSLAGWPGRPVILPLTGGRDSRVVLAGALASGVEFSAETSALPRLPGYPETADVKIARRLCEVHGRPHKINLPRPSDVDLDLDEALAVLRSGTPGTFSLGGISPNMVTDFLAPEGADRLRLLLSGANGEIARTYYGLGDGLDAGGLASHLHAKLLHRYPRPLLSEEGEAVVRSYLQQWTADALDAGVASRDVPDLFYVRERMSNWAGPLHGISEYTRDVASPLWAGRMVRHQVAPPAPERSAGRFHASVLAAMAPELAGMEYEGATYGTARLAQVAKRAEQARAEIRRRLGRGTSSSGRGDDAFLRSFASIRETVLGVAATHPAWSVLDRTRTERLLHRDPARLDPRSREQVWRLASILLPDARD